MLPAAALLAGCAVSGASRLWSRRTKSSRPGGWPVWCYALMVAMTVIARSSVWFTEPLTQIARGIYGNDPLPESEVIAEYIRDHSAPDARVAVLGSEPEIYFLARRHSATGYLYTYGLMEEQPFARQMQDEMIREIDQLHARRTGRHHIADQHGVCLGSANGGALWQGRSRERSGGLPMQNRRERSLKQS
jgi:hypothetical protein